jgi:sigma-E factor negative regulatory protein RseB
VTSVAILVLILAPALVIVTGAEALPTGKASPLETARPGARGAAQSVARHAGQLHGTGRAPAGHIGDAISAPHTPMRASTADGGVHLLRQAVAAGRTISYRGVQIISWWSPDGTATVAVDVTHESSQGTLLQTMGAGTVSDGQSFMANETQAQPGDVLGITEETLDLLAANYQVVAVGSGSACDRPATVVEALRGDGTVAAKFWLDEVTKITLRRELFDDQARMINESAFIDLKLGWTAAAGPMSAQSAAAVDNRPWNVLTAAAVGRLRATGWPIPADLPGGLGLFDARQVATPTGRVLELGYSDGLSGVSLFVQRGDLPGRLAGWREAEVGGRTVYARNPISQGLTWSSHNYVLTVIADAPAATISSVVRTLPYDGQCGFWSRLRHGFRRVISWVDPFG